MWHCDLPLGMLAEVVHSRIGGSPQTGPESDPQLPLQCDVCPGLIGRVHYSFKLGIFSQGSRDSSVSIATGYGLEFDPWQGQDFSLLCSIQTSSGAHPASYPMGTGGDFPRGEVARVWSWSHLPLVPRPWMVELYLHFPILLHSSA
jgi:hypothetical protein